MHPNFYCSPVNVFVLWLSGYEAWIRVNLKIPFVTCIFVVCSIISDSYARGCVFKYSNHIIFEKKIVTDFAYFSEKHLGKTQLSRLSNGYKFAK